MGISRRDFLSGGASLGLGAFGGLRLFAAPAGWKHPGKANLVVGIVSDTHLITDKEGRLAWLRGPEFKVIGTGSPAKYFAAALKYFRDQNVDAVLHCGDITDAGQIREMEAAAALWRHVFPNNCAPDGHRVEKLFVTGNHDAEGMGMRWLKAVWPDLEERKRLSFTSDIPGIWERIWGEKYEPVWHKEVKGYHFLGRHWETDWTDYRKMVRDFMGEQGASSRPFFMLSHAQDGRSDAAKAAKAEFKKSMADCRNAVAFCGHWHQSLTNWNMILFWLNENVPELRCPSCAPFGGLAPHHDGWIFKNRKAGVNARKIGAWRQGMVMRVYDDMIVFQRKEFGDGGVFSLGQDWIMPIERYEVRGTRYEVRGTRDEGRGKREEVKGKREEGREHPFSRGELIKVIGEPQFREGAKLEVENVANVEILPNANIQSQLETGNIGIGNTGNIGNIVVKIPLADGNPKSRVYAYEVVIEGRGTRYEGRGKWEKGRGTRDEGKGKREEVRGTRDEGSEKREEGSGRLCMAVYAAGCNMGIGREPNGGVTTLEIAKSELPPGEKLTVTVHPLSSLGTRGTAIAAEFERG